MLKSVIGWIAILFCSVALFGQNADEKPAWNVTLQADKTARSNLTVQNRCKKNHNFEIRGENVSFLEISQTQVSVGGGGNKNVPVRFNSFNLVSKIYQGQVLVICKTCKKEPTCTQDREVLPVVLTVTDIRAVSNPSKNGNADNVKNSTKKKDPCKEECLDLLKIANEKDLAAKKPQDTADTAKANADKEAAAANSAEESAKKAEQMAIDPPRNDRAIINGDKYTTADNEYQRKLALDIGAALASGRITAKEYQRQIKANTVKRARELRKKNLKRLKKEAKKARKTADAAKRKAEKAKADAEAAQKVADDAKKEADNARDAYNDCVKKAKEECDKIKAAEAKRIADEKALEAKRLADIKAAEDARVTEQKHRAAVEKKRIEQKKEDARLLKLIKKMNLVSKKIRDVPGIWQWLPDILETPVGVLAEAVSATPVPTDILKALGGVAGIYSSIQDPCNVAVGQPRIKERLRKMINKKTGRLYNEPEADAEVKNMCNLMKRLKANAKAIQARQQKTK